MSDIYHLPQISCWMAYQVLPHYAFEACDKAVENWTKTPSVAGPFYYLMACRMGKVEPVTEDARKYSTSLATRGEHDCYLMEFPLPPPVDLSQSDPLNLMRQGSQIVLAPHFAAIVRNRISGEVRYFVLGQSPIGGGTTFRSVTREGANANHGPGPSPQRELFLQRVQEALQ